MTAENRSDLTFEMAMQRLEETVRRLESADLPLDQAIAAYQEAMYLVKYCREQLDRAELEIAKLVEQPDGVRVERFGEGA
ncbi:MAG: exodeoxyribonuclease VII small subunit [Thermoflavifilum sp.]|nr:exodeoxyribonuclease VII small subunit [Thermoflavifilum sp.]MCL6514020.1 exodeoxyribonuclease VII small subunit [Alicyclobacillus sp.]